MGYLLGAVTQGVLDEQRGVVQNEKRQGDNQPYGLTQYKITQGCSPPTIPMATPPSVRWPIWMPPRSTR